jgi:hypothetical protein
VVVVPPLSETVSVTLVLVFWSQPVVTAITRLKAMHSTKNRLMIGSPETAKSKPWGFAKPRQTEHEPRRAERLAEIDFPNGLTHLACRFDAYVASLDRNARHGQLRGKRVRATKNSAGLSGCASGSVAGCCLDLDEPSPTTLVSGEAVDL